MNGLKTLPLFLAVAEDRSFTGAARRLGMSPSATGKAIARLEEQLGVALFQRTTRSVRLTEAGELLFERAHAIRETWREAEALLVATKVQPTGCLRMTIPAIGHRLIVPYLAGFLARYPGLSIDIDQNDHFVDLTEATMDLAIRSGELQDSSYRSRKLTDFRFWLCASPAYLARHGTPQSVTDLQHHTHIRFRYPDSAGFQPWRLSGLKEPSLAQIALASTNMEGVLSATLQGLGIAQMPDFLVKEDLEAGRLVSLLQQDAPTGHFWLIWPDRLHRLPKIRAFVDYIVLAMTESR